MPRRKEGEKPEKRHGQIFKKENIVMRSNAMKRLLKIRAKNIFWIHKQVTGMYQIFSHFK